MQQTKTILLVEDNNGTARALRQALTGVGYAVLIVSDGPQALEFLSSSKTPPDLILLDLLLPGRDGFDVLRVCRQEKHLMMPIVVLSNLSQDADRARAFGLGATDYLVKSIVSIQTIVQRIAEIFATTPSTTPQPH